MMKVFQLFIALCVYLTQSVHSTDPDTHSECGSWAERGECEVGAMLILYTNLLER